jgi:hypothetical protein
MMNSGRNGPETEKANDIIACTVTINQSVRCHGGFTPLVVS